MVSLFLTPSRMTKMKNGLTALYILTILLMSVPAYAEGAPADDEMIVEEDIVIDCIDCEAVDMDEELPSE